MLFFYIPVTGVARNYEMISLIFWRVTLPFNVLQKLPNFINVWMAAAHDIERLPLKFRKANMISISFIFSFVVAYKILFSLKTHFPERNDPQANRTPNKFNIFERQCSQKQGLY